MRVVLPSGPPPAPPRMFLDILRDAEKLCASPGEQGKAVHLLRELLLWAGLSPSPAERERILAFQGNPAHYTTLPVQIQINQQAPGQIMPLNTPQGVVETVVMHMLLAMPLGNLRTSTILGSTGEAANPCEGMMPVLDARFVLPRQRVAPHVLQQVGLEAKPTEE